MASNFKGRKHTAESIALMRSRHYGGVERLAKNNGYIYVYAPDHPRAINGRIPENVAVMESYLGRHLHDDEVPHHINLDKHDNRIENLQLLTMTEHKKLHAKLRGFGTVIKPEPLLRETDGRFRKRRSAL